MHDKFSSYIDIFIIYQWTPPIPHAHVRLFRCTFIQSSIELLSRYIFRILKIRICLLFFNCCFQNNNLCKTNIFAYHLKYVNLSTCRCKLFSQNFKLQEIDGRLPDTTAYDTVMGSKRLTKSSLAQMRNPDLVINLKKEETNKKNSDTRAVINDCPLVM